MAMILFVLLLLASVIVSLALAIVELASGHPVHLLVGALVLLAVLLWVYWEDISHDIEQEDEE